MDSYSDEILNEMNQQNAKWEADRKLRAAAPDLLAAARLALDFIYDGIPNNAARAIEAAIRKAGFDPHAKP